MSFQPAMMFCGKIEKRCMKKNLQCIALFALIIIFLSGCAKKEPFRKGPYLLYAGDNTRMDVLWQLDNLSAPCTITWGTSPSLPTESAQVTTYGDDSQYRASLSGLKPGTRYYYRVSADTAERTGSFTAAPERDAAAVSFFAYGDFRLFPRRHNAVAGAMLDAMNYNQACQSMVLVVGDMVYNGIEYFWQSDLFNQEMPNVRSLLTRVAYQPVRGNHETYTFLAPPCTPADIAELTFAKYLPFPFADSFYWSFDYGPLHVVMVDQYDSAVKGIISEEQVAWIEKDLAATDRPWKAVVLHEPGYSAGGRYENSVDVQEKLQPLCVAYHVALVFSGHNHYYAHAVVNGVHHVTTAGGGAELVKPDASAPYVVKAVERHHFCKIDIAGSTLTLTAIAPDGDVLDTFIVTQ